MLLPANYVFLVSIEMDDKSRKLFYDWFGGTKNAFFLSVNGKYLAKKSISTGSISNSAQYLIFLYLAKNLETNNMVKEYYPQMILSMQECAHFFVM